MITPNGRPGVPPQSAGGVRNGVDNARPARWVTIAAPSSTVPSFSNPAIGEPIRRPRRNAPPASARPPFPPGDRTPTGCTHVSGCPLFPKLNASLRGWRDAYCDSDTGWSACARYQRSLSGQVVPLTLLPNGRDALAIAPTEPVGAAPSRSRFAPRTLDGLPGSFEAAPPQARPVPPRAAVLPRPAAVLTAEGPTPDPQPGRPGWWARRLEWLRSAA